MVHESESGNSSPTSRIFVRDHDEAELRKCCVSKADFATAKDSGLPMAIILLRILQAITASLALASSATAPVVTPDVEPRIRPNRS